LFDESKEVGLERSETGFDMSRFVRQTLVALLIAFHAAVTLCGPCLHAVPGFGHGSVLESSAKRHQAVDMAGARHASMDDCPICHFLTQGQLPIESSSIASVRLAVEFEPVADVDWSPAPPRLPFCPRGPPVVYTSVS
jgi:hypothetical protein